MEPNQERKPYRLWRRKSSGYYYFMLRGETRWRSTGETKEHAAIEYVLSVLNAPAPAQSLREYALPAFEAYARARELAGGKKALGRSYVTGCRRYLKAWILTDPIADKSLTEISARDYQDFQSRLLGERLADRRTTAIRVLEVLRLILRRAKKEGIIAVSPDEAVVKADEEARVRTPYTRQELEALFPADVWQKKDFAPWQGPLDYTAFLVAASTGMRKGETLALDWSAVHLEEGEEYVEIRGSLETTTSIRPTKAKRPRACPIFDQVLWPDRRCVRALHELRKLQVVYRIVDMQGRPQGPVFSLDGQTRMGRTWWQKRLASALKVAGIERDRGEGAMPLDAHALRHTLASALKAAGLPDELIRRFCGWSSMAVQERYTTIGPDVFERVMRQIRMTS